MTERSQFVGYGVQVELKDGKLIQGKIARATAKGLTLNDVKFGDGGTSQAFKVRSSRLKDLKVLTAPQNMSINNNRGNSKSRSNNNNNNSNTSNIKMNSGNNASDWQDDDVRKIKDQEDFDFQSNLTLFNKKDVFAQLKQQDEIDPDQRLVSFNKKNNDGNDNGKVNSINNINYDYDEMVIPNAKDDHWDKVEPEFGSNNEIEDFETEEEDEVDETSSNNRNSSHSNENHDDDDDDDDDYEFDDIDDPKYLPITKSINITHLLHSAVNKADADDAADQLNGITGNGKGDNSQLLNKLEQMLISQSNTSRSASLSNTPPTLKNKKNNQLIPMASPVELLEIERIANETFDITKDVLNEIFGYNACSLVKTNLGGSARLTVQNSNPEPLVVILISDINRSGIKALTLARYLSQLKQLRVIILFSCPINDIQDKFVLNKIDIFKNSGGKIVNSLSNLQVLMAKLNSPVELIIDAMQGFDSNLNDFSQSRSSNTKIVEIINWCNNTKLNKHVKIWSIDLPSGHDSSTGVKNFEVSIESVDKVICSYSWPLVCLKTMDHIIQRDSSLGSDNNNPIVIIDCGIPKNVYSQKNSLRKFGTVDTFVTNGAIGLTW